MTTLSNACKPIGGTGSTLTDGDLRPEAMNDDARPTAEYAVERIAELENISVRRARAVVQYWFSQQHSGEPVPRVDRRRGPVGGYPRYYVNVQSYKAWTAARSLDAEAKRTAGPRVRRRKIGARGCLCGIMTLEDGSIAGLVVASCPHHGSILQVEVEDSEAA